VVVRRVPKGFPKGSKGTMYEVGMAGIIEYEYERWGREETVIGKGLTAGSSPPYQ
jgi:hypothetical protein